MTKIEVAHTETIDGVQIDYLTDWDNRFVSKDMKGLLQGYGKQIAPIAAKKGYKRVQIGSLGDMSYFGLTSGRFVPLSTMFVARFLKR